MITPRFSVDQTSTSIVVHISVPSARLEDADVDFTEDVFMFSCKPYYLRLHFPCPVKPIDAAADLAKILNIDLEKNDIHVTIPKANIGETFPQLDNLSRLLNPSKATNVVEIAGGNFDEEGLPIDEFMAQTLAPEVVDPEAAEKAQIIAKYGYGFAFLHHGELGRLKDELTELFEIAKVIEESEISGRSALCRDLDVIAFDPQYFLADYYDTPGEVAECIAFKIPAKIALSKDDEAELAKIRKRKFPQFSELQLRHALLGLVDVLYAYVYDQKTNLGESTCESSWTFAKLAPTFSTLARYESALEAFVSAVRRTLCYALYRNFDLAKSCVAEVVSILKQGPKAVLHCLLSMRPLLAVEIHYRYLLNSLFLDEFCAYLRDMDPKDFNWLAIEAEIAAPKVTLECIDLDLPALIEAGGLGGASLEAGDAGDVLDSDDDSDPE
uniref:Protein SHQ1 homolog n=1 Tax=Panagrellus redivivus TaxID=6233 RepID=A0A7E4UVT6_PANRE